MKKIDIEAKSKNLEKVMQFVTDELEKTDCSLRAKMQIEIAVEEIFVNIANYAYGPESGLASIRVEVKEDPVVVKLVFVDNGKPYDPIAKKDPDITLSAEEREIGGLGIFLAKKNMDEIHYEYKDGQNILTLIKNL